MLFQIARYVGEIFKITNAKTQQKAVYFQKYPKYFSIASFLFSKNVQIYF